MPMTFGASCESHDESAYARRKRTRQEAKARKAAASDPFERIVVLCSVRDRSSTELVDRLESEGYSAGEAHAAVERSLECGLVDDMRFAEGFIRGRMSAGKGVVAIEKELAKHGIDACVLDDWPDAYGLGEDDQVESAIDYRSAHPPKAKDAWSAAFRKLVGRGYAQSVASRATRRWMESLE